MTDKVWGTTTALLQTPIIEVHKLVILPRSRCSLHKHVHKWNAFYVTSGVLHVEEPDSHREHILEPGEFATFAPGRFHRFFTRTRGAECLEIYYPEPLSEDIIRLTVGERNYAQA